MEGRIELGTERRHLGVHVEVTDALDKHWTVACLVSRALVDVTAPCCCCRRRRAFLSNEQPFGYIFAASA